MATKITYKRNRKQYTMEDYRKKGDSLFNTETSYEKRRKQEMADGVRKSLLDSVSPSYKGRLAMEEEEAQNKGSASRSTSVLDLITPKMKTKTTSEKERELTKKILNEDNIINKQGRDPESPEVQTAKRFKAEYQSQLQNILNQNKAAEKQQEEQQKKARLEYNQQSQLGKVQAKMAGQTEAPKTDFVSSLLYGNKSGSKTKGSTVAYQAGTGKSVGTAAGKKQTAGIDTTGVLKQEKRSTSGTAERDITPVLRNIQKKYGSDSFAYKTALQQAQDPNSKLNKLSDLLRTPAPGYKDTRGTAAYNAAIRDAGLRDMDENTDITQMSENKLLANLEALRDRVAQKDLMTQEEENRRIYENEKRNEPANRMLQIAMNGLEIAPNRALGIQGGTVYSRPEDYDVDPIYFDSTLYDFVHGENTYYNLLNGDDEAAFDEADDEIQKMWDFMESGKMGEMAEEYRIKSGATNTQSIIENKNAEERKITQIQDELERRQKIREMETKAALKQTKKAQQKTGISGNTFAQKIASQLTGPGGDEIDQIYYQVTHPETGMSSDQLMTDESYAKNAATWNQLGVQLEANGIGKAFAETTKTYANIYKHMTQEQAESFVRLYGDGSAEEKQAAKEYIDALMPELKQAQTEYETQRTIEDASGQYGAYYGAARILRQPIAGLMGTIGAGAALLGDKDAQDKNSGFYQLQNVNNATQEARAKVWDDQMVNMFGEGVRGVGSFLNGVAYSMADMLVATGISGGVTSLAGKDMAGKLAEGVIQFVMSSEATSATMLENLQKGRDPVESALRAFGSGAIEAVTEKYSIEALLKPNVRDLLGNKKALGRYLLKNTIAEGTEEVASDALNTVLDELLSRVYDHKSEITEEYDQLKRVYGEKDASRMVLENYLSQLGSSFLGGALSGALMSGSRAAATRVGMAMENKGIGQKITSWDGNERTSRLIEAGTGMNPGTESAKLATKMQEAMQKGKKPSNRQVGELARSIVNESNEEIGNITRDVLADSIQEDLIAKGESREVAAKLKDTLVKMIVDGDFSGPGMEMLVGNKRAQEILKEYRGGEKTAQVQARVQEQAANAQSVQETVKNIVTGKDAEQARTERILQMTKDAKTITGADLLLAEGKRTNTAAEVVAERKISEIQGVRGAKAILADGREVNISDVRATNEQTAQVLKYIQNDANRTSSDRVNNVLLKHAGEYADAAAAISEAAKIRMAEMLGKSSIPETRLSAEMAEEIREASREDFREAEEKRLEGAKEIKPGEGKATFLGAEYGSKEWKENLKQLDKEQRQEAEAIAEIAKAAGFDVEIINDENDVENQGSFSGAGIVINMAGENYGGEHHNALVTFGHEITHNLEANSREAYANLRTFVLNTLEKQGVNLENRLNDVIDNYAANGVELDLNGAIAELVAKGCDQILSDEKVVRQLRQSDPGLFTKVKEAVQDLIDRMRSAMERMSGSMSFESRNLRQSMDELSRLWLGAYEEAKGAESGTIDGKEYSFAGKDPETGDSIYISNYAEGTPKTVKRKDFINNIQNVFSKNPVKLEVTEENGTKRSIYASFDPDFDESGKRQTDAGKLAYNKKVMSNAEDRVRLNISGDMLNILEESEQARFPKPDKTGNPDIKMWHYFNDDIYYVAQGSDVAEPYKIDISIKEMNDGSFVYTYEAIKDDSRQTKKLSLMGPFSPVNAGKSSGESATASTERISQKQENRKTQKSIQEDLDAEYQQAVKDQDWSRAEDAVLEKYTRTNESDRGGAGQVDRENHMVTVWANDGKQTAKKGSGKKYSFQDNPAMKYLQDLADMQVKTNNQERDEILRKYNMTADSQGKYLREGGTVADKLLQKQITKKDQQRLDELAEDTRKWQKKRYEYANMDEDNPIVRYVDAWRRSDKADMEQILMDKMNNTEGVIPYKAAEWYDSDRHRTIANLIKENNPEAIMIASAEMAELVPDNAVLIPMPPHEGKVTENTDTMLLARAISELTGRPVINALEGNDRESRRDSKQKAKSRQVTAADMGFRQTQEIPEGTIPYFIDNLVASGVTAQAAHDAFGKGITLAYAKSTRAAMNGLKDAAPTYYDKYHTKLIPLDERFDMSRTGVKGVRHSVQDKADARETELENEMYSAQEEENNWREKYREIKNSDEMKNWTNKIYEEKDREKRRALMEEYKKFEEKSGIKEAAEALQDAKERTKQARKALDDYVEERDVAAEQKAIEESGLSEADFRRKAAYKEFGYTGDFREAGYLLPNGRLLNFRGEKGKHYGMRGEDHRRIGVIYASSKYKNTAGMTAFMNDGNIRVMAETPGIDISTEVEPTKEQYAAIRNMARIFAKEELFSVDFSDKNGNYVGNVEYEGRISPERIVNDIKTFFRTGEVPQQSVASQFHYSMQDKADADYMAAVNSGNTEKAQEMVDRAARRAGYTIHAYHGTGRGDRVGNVFLPERATSGPMAFFTDSKEIAENYAKDKMDTSIAYDDEFGSDYFTQFRVKQANGKSIPVGDLWKSLSYKEKQRITEAGKHIAWDDTAENIIYDPEMDTGNGGFNEWTLRDKKGNAIEALVEAWLNSGELYGNEEEFFKVMELAGIKNVIWNDPYERHEKVYDTYLKIQNPYQVSTMFTDEFLNDLEDWWADQDQEKYKTLTASADLWDKNNRTVEEWVDYARDNIKKGYTTVWTSIPDAITDYLKSKGYDGIQDQGGKGGGKGHTVWIPFTSEQIKSAEPVVYGDDWQVVPLSERFNPEKKDIRYSIQDMTDMDVNQWMMSVNENSLQTESEKQLLRNFKDLRMRISLSMERQRNYRHKIAVIESKPENLRTEEDKRTLKNLQTGMETAKNRQRDAEDQLAKITSSEGYAGLMYRQNRILNDFIYGHTQAEVRDAVEKMESSAAKIAARIVENQKAVDEIEASGIVQKMKSLLGKTTADQTAADLKKEFHSSWTKTEIRNYLDPILLKMSQGEDFSSDVEELAGILVDSDTRNVYDDLSALRGMQITLGKGAQKELRAQNSSLKEIRRRLAGTGITVKYGDRSTLESDIEDLRAEYPNMPDMGDEKDALENFVSWVEGMKRQSAADEFYDQRLADAMTTVMKKAAGAASGIYIPAEAKARDQVMGLVEYIKTLKARTENAEKTLLDIAGQMGEMQKSGRDAVGMVNVLQRDVNVAIDYYNKTAKIAEDTAKKKKTSEIIEQLKSKQAEKILKINEEWRNMIQRDRQARKQLEENNSRKGMVNTDVKRLYHLLSNPTGTKNIPEHMRGLARHLVEQFVDNDLSEIRTKLTKADRKQLEEARRRLSAWTAQDGDFDIADLTAMDDGGALTIVNQDLMTLYDTIEKWNGDFSRKSKLEQLQERGEILKQMTEALGEIYNYIQAEREIALGERRVLIEDAAYKVQQETGGKRHEERTGKIGRKLAGLKKAIVSGNMIPEYFFRTIGNEGLNDLWEEYHRAENRNGLELRKAQTRLANIAEKHGYSQWDTDKKMTVHLSSGDVRMTLGEIMSLYATWNREQQLGPEMSEHLKKGGFYVEPDLKSGILGKQAVEKRAHRVTEEDMQAVGQMLTDEQKNLVNDVVGFMSTDMSELGNEASMKAYGIKMYKEGYYFPFQMWDGIRSRKSNDSGSAAKQDRAFHPSFSKSRMHGANNALILGDFMQTAADHVAGMINYATMGLANENLQKVLNQQIEEGEGEDLTKRNIRAILEEAYGSEAMQYLAKLQEQLNGGAVRVDKSFYDKAISLFRKNAVAGSLSVAAQQPLSYIRAATMISPKYLARAISPDTWKGSYKEMMDHSGVAVIKEMGKFDMNAGQSAREYLMPDEKKSKAKAAGEKFVEYTTILPELMDRATWTRMWSAVKAEQAAQHPGMDTKSDEFLDMVGERFNELMRRTQVYDSTLVRSQNMRSQNPAVKSLTSFMAEPTLTMNVLADAVRSAKNGESGGKALLAKAGATFLASAALQAAVKAMFSTGRSPDEKKTWYENFMYRFGNNLISEADPLTLIPGYGDLITVLKDGKLQDDAMGAVGKIFTAAKTGLDAMTGKKSNGWWRDLEDSAAQLAQLFMNVPAKNIMRDMRAMYNWFIGKPYADRETSAAVLKHQARESLVSGDNLIGVLNDWLGDAGYETKNKAYYQRVYEAKKAGNEQEAQSLIDYLLKGKGVKQETIDNGVKSLARNDESMTADERAEFMIDEGMDPGQFILDQVKEGTMTAEDARKRLKESDPDADENSIWWKVDRAEYKRETGNDAGSGTYYRLKDAISENKSDSIRAAVKQLTDHGATVKNIQTAISGYKSEYLEAKGQDKIRLKDALIKAYKATGMTAEDANKKINGWK